MLLRNNCVVVGYCFRSNKKSPMPSPRIGRMLYSLHSRNVPQTTNP